MKLSPRYFQDLFIPGTFPTNRGGVRMTISEPGKSYVSAGGYADLVSALNGVGPLDVDPPPRGVRRIRLKSSEWTIDIQISSVGSPGPAYYLSADAYGLSQLSVIANNPISADNLPDLLTQFSAMYYGRPLMVDPRSGILSVERKPSVISDSSRNILD
jgi:hypothetical protein